MPNNDFGLPVAKVVVAVTYRNRLRELAFDHHGIVTTAMARSVGVPPVEVRKLAARGALIRTGHGVYRMTEAPTDPLTEFAEAVSIVGEGAFIADESVLNMHELALVNPPTITVATDRRVRITLPDRIRIAPIKTNTIEIDHIDGVPTMPLGLALIRCKDRIRRERMENAIDESLARKLLTEVEAGNVRQALSEKVDFFFSSRIEPNE